MTEKSLRRIILIIPAYNEEESILEVCKEVEGLYDYIVINNI